MADINIGAISEALNNKVDLPIGDSQDGIDFVVDWQNPTTQNNYTWYRKYKSGWVEQGGQRVASNGTTTVSLPIEMANTYYTATGGIIYTGASTGTVGFQFVKNTTSIVIAARWNGAFNDGLAVDWQVSGMAATTRAPTTGGYPEQD